MSELLSSDILERQFGPTILEVLWQDDATRLIATKVKATGQVLELSQVVFNEPGIAGFPEVHREVVAGKSMGKAFAERAIPFKRQVHAAYRYDQHDLPGSFSERFGAELPPTVVDVSILVGPDSTPYADILEVYSPEVSWQLNGGEMAGTVVDRIRAFDELLTRHDS
jgi:hypothetical protein